MYSTGLRHSEKTLVKQIRRAYATKHPESSSLSFHALAEFAAFADAYSFLKGKLWVI